MTTMHASGRRRDIRERSRYYTAAAAVAATGRGVRQLRHVRFAAADTTAPVAPRSATDPML